MARASGSYPAGRWFKSDFRYQKDFLGSPFLFYIEFFVNDIDKRKRLCIIVYNNTAARAV